MVVDGSWVDLITRVGGTFFLERQGFASFLHKTILATIDEPFHPLLSKEVGRVGDIEDTVSHLPHEFERRASPCASAFNIH